MLIKYWLPLVTLLLLAPKPVLAAHSGSAPTDPSKPDDENFIVDTDSGLDTGCTFRDGGPLVFKIKVDRYVGETNGDGTLKEPQKLSANKVVSTAAHLKMPAYDIDLSDGEVDEVYFNGHKLDTPLQGSNGTWNENSFTVPIEWVKFPTARGINGEKPVAAENEIRVDIDTRNAGWCASIDWAELHFKAMSPLILIHGIGANPQAAWEVEPGVTEYLTSLGVPFEHRIPISPNNSILPDIRRGLPGNAQILQDQVRLAAQSFGVKKVHLVGHSKGGLDSRGYLSEFYRPEEVKVLSLHTISSPHHGSVLADISIEARTRLPRPIAQDGDGEMIAFLRDDSWLQRLQRGPQLPGLDDLRTGRMRDFNTSISLPSEIKFYSYGADADLDNDGDINDAEANPFLPLILGSGNIPFVYNRAESGTVAYHILRDVSTIRIRRVVRDINIIPFFPPELVIENDVIRFPTTSRQLNDLAVTTNSSKLGNEEHFSPLERNHRNVKDPETMDRILAKIRRDFPSN